MALRTKNAVILAKVQTGPGVAASPVAGTDAIRMVTADFVTNAQVDENEEYNGSLDDGEPDVSIPTATVTGTFHVKGSGAAGSVPEASPLYQGCAMGETTVASTSVTYDPLSVGEKLLTIYCYKDGLLYQGIDFRGSLTFDFTTRRRPTATATLLGKFISKTDAVLPTATYQSITAPTWKDATAHINSIAAAIQQFTLDMGVTSAALDDPNDVVGIAEIINASRNITGTINPLEVLVATRDLFADIVAETKQELLIVNGATAGNIATLTVPQMKLTGESPADDQGAQRPSYSFDAVGINDGMSLVFT